MPYRRKPRSQRKHFEGKVPKSVLNKCTPEKQALIKFGIVPQSIKQDVTHQPLTKKLASSSKRDRDAGVALVASILSNEDKQLSHEGMTQLWKALFYAFWMSDKVLVQHNLAKKLASFIKTCSSDSVALLYMQCFIECMEREWPGIDYLRMSKFQSLVRYFIHSMFDLLALREWDLHLVQSFANILRLKTNLMLSSNRGFFLHLCDLYVPEMIKINEVNASLRPPIAFDALYNLLCPFISIYVETSKTDQEQYIIHQVFHVLLESMASDQEIPTEIRSKRNKIQFWSEEMLEVDPNNPTRRKKNETHLMFDEKNYDVVVPFEEVENDSDREKMKQWQKKYEESIGKREYDPLLLREKMEKFHKVFEYLSADQDTPKPARNKLKILTRMFKPESDGNDYDKAAYHASVQASFDKIRLMRKLQRLRKLRSRRTRTLLKRRNKWKIKKIKKIKH